MSTELKKNLDKNRDVNLVIVHLGELVLKGGNRGWFEDKLINGLRASLQGLCASSISNQSGRIVIEFAEYYAVQLLKDKLSRVFGVATFAPAVCAAPNPADIEKIVLSCLSDRQFRTFAVRARRIDKRLPFSSLEVNEKIGHQIIKSSGQQVNLDNPELTVGIEILSDRAYIYADKFKGAGGLPTGASGRVACLISGGIDSPVAAWRMMKRGCEVDFIHFHSAPFTDSASQEKVTEIVEILQRWQCGRGRLNMVPFGDIQRKIVTAVPEKYRVIIYRRFMVRMAEKIARGWGCEALITGEALGQVASQTLSNMATVNSAAAMPILRPLVGMDKQEIVDSAKEIGTYDLSILPHQDCCQFLEPRHPATRTTAEELQKVEEGLGFESLIKDGLTGVKQIGNE